MKQPFFNSTKKDYFIYFIIFMGLFLALIPVILSNNYLRQDDMKTGIWWGMKISDEGYLYYNTVYQLVRPICMLIFYIIDLISINMHHAVYVRLASIITVGILGILLYNWQGLFNPNRLLAASFAIASFTLPGIQLFSATANYFLIIFGLLLTLGAAFFWHYAYLESDPSKKRKYYLGACLLFMLSLLDYPLSSMYIWVLAVICYLNTLKSFPSNQQKFAAVRPISFLRTVFWRSNSEIPFFYYLCRASAYVMLAYFLLIKIVHLVFHVQLDKYSAVINFSNFAGKLLQPVTMFVIQGYLWFYEAALPSDHYLPILFISLSCLIALIRIHLTNGISPFIPLAKKCLLNISIVLFLFVLAYSPLLALPDFSYTFRYTIATMPFIMYLLFWSVNINLFAASTAFFSKILASFFFIFMALFGIYYANLMLGDGMVGPQTHDYNFIEQELREKALPYLEKNQRLAIHVIDCDHGTNYQFAKSVPFTLEYGMRLCAYPNHLIGAINHVLQTLGYSSNFNRANTVITQDDEQIVKDVPWGYMVFSSSEKLNYHEPNTATITIDMRKIKIYQHLDFYKNLLGLNG